MVDYCSDVAALIDLVDEYSKALAARDFERAVSLYASDAIVVRYEGVAKGPEEISAFLVNFLSGYDRFDLISVDQIQTSGDTVVWDASHDTDAGALQTTNVFVVNDAGLIIRHIPLPRGYWGHT